MENKLIHSHLGFGAGNMGQLYPMVLQAILDRGKTSSPRGLATIELLGASVFLSDARNALYTGKARDLNYKFAIAEWLWMMAGRSDVATVARYNRNIAKFSDDGVTFAGAYGPRIMSQLKHVLDSLRQPDSRQAVISIWAPSPGRSNDIPCTLTLQFLLREGKLNLIATMRSSDAFLGLAYDIHNFAMIQNAIAGALGTEIGFILMQLGSLHLYEENWEAAKGILAHESTRDINIDPCFVRAPRLPGLPPAGQMLDYAAADYERAAVYGEPWDSYIKALRKPTKGEALLILRRLSDDDRSATAAAQ